MAWSGAKFAEMKFSLFLVTFSAFSVALPLSAQFNLGDLTNRAADAAENAASEFNVPPEIIDQAKDLAKSFGFSRANLAKHASDAITALNGGEDLKALGLLNRIGDANLSDSQRSAFVDLKQLVDTYVLKQNFGGDKKASGPVGKAVEAITAGDYAGAVGQLDGLMNTLKPTGGQLAMLTTLKDQYAEWAEEAAEEAEPAE